MGAISFKNVICALLSLICGAVFIFSAATKLMPVEAFEITLVDIGVANWHTAPFIARLMIGLEFATGFLLIFLFRLKRFTIPFAALLIAVFTVYLIYVIKVYGNKGNCGCFGAVIEISPLEGIAKNIVLLILLALIWFLATPFEFRFKLPLAAIGVLVLMILPFILNPMGYPFVKKPISEFKHFKLRPVIPEMTKGKQIVALFSATCPHCRLAAKKLTVIEKQHPEIPMLFVIYNNKKKVDEFFDDTKSESVTHLLMDNKDDFGKLTGYVFPRIYWMNDSIVEYETNYIEFNEAEVEAWLHSSR
jgi:hypothetical protein